MANTTIPTIQDSLTSVASTMIDYTIRLDTLETAGYATEDWVESQEYALATDLDALMLDVDSNLAAIDDNATEIAANASDIAGIEGDLDIAYDLMAYLQVDTSTDSVTFTGANVYVQSASVIG